MNQELRTLIVEDDVTSRMILKSFLEEFGPVSTAPHGERALEVFGEAIEAGTPFNLVCLDIMMPRMSGQETLERLRAAEEEAGMLPKFGSKILMISALDDVRTVMASYQSLCDGYLAKPTTHVALIDELKKLNLIP
ncbi:MAG: response regulator [Halothiobacillaceae bacterium]